MDGQNPAGHGSGKKGLKTSLRPFYDVEFAYSKIILGPGIPEIWANLYVKNGIKKAFITELIYSNWVRQIKKRRK